MALSPEQRRNVQVALRVARREGASRRVQKALLEAMSVESNFRHLNYGMDDSVGILQQRPSQGWGPAGEGVRKDVRDFLERAIPLNRSFSGSAGQLAQAVQRSAYPERYDERSAQANRLLRRFGGAPMRGGQGTSRKRARGSAMPGLDVTTTALAGVLAQAQRPQIPSAGLAAPEFSAGVTMPEGARLPVSGGGPSAPDPVAALSAVLPALTGLGAPGQRRGRNRPGGGAQRGRGARPGHFKRGDLLEMFHDPGINVDEGRRTSPIGKHGQHVHVAGRTPAAVKAAARLAFSMGLTVKENPKWDPVDPVHTQGSFHGRRFPRRRLGMAIDVSGGSAAQLKAYNRRVARMFGV